MRLRSLVSSVALLFALGSCQQEPGIALKDQTQRTVVAYLFGDVNLWDAMLMSINQMEAGWSPETNGTLLVYLDASPHVTQFGGPVLLEIAHDTTEAIVSRVVKRYPDRDAADPAVFAEVLRDATELYPAQSHGLIVGGHANGWLTTPEDHSKSIGNSERFNGPQLDIDQLAAALPVHYDFIVFHACLMGEAAALYQLRDKTDYVLASVESLPGYAYPYHEVVPTLFTQPYADLYRFSTLTQDYYASKIAPTGHLNYMTVGAYRMAKMEELAAQTKKAIERIGPTYAQLLNYMYDQTVRDPSTNGLLSYPQSAPQSVLFFDFGLLCELTQSVDPAVANELSNAVKKVVIQNYAVGGRLDLSTYTTRSLGLSFYVPYPKSLGPAVEDINRAFYTRFGWSAAAGFTAKWE